MKLLTVVSSTDMIIKNGQLTEREPAKKEEVIMSCYTTDNRFRFATETGVTTTSLVKTDCTYGDLRVIMTQNSAYVFKM